MQKIQPGHDYWIDFDDHRLKVEAIREPPELLGWWLCAFEDGSQAIFPEAALTERAD